MESRQARAKPARKPRPVAPGPGDPDVIVDFPFDKGLLFVALHNVGVRTAIDVSVRFHRKFRGLGGRVSIPDNQLFRHLGLLAPRREIRTLVDDWHAYVSRGEPSELTAWVSFQDHEGRPFRRKVVHDLTAYRDLVWVAPERKPGTPDHPHSFTDTGGRRPWRR